MSLVLSQTNGRVALRQVLRGGMPSLVRFNVEPSVLHSYGFCASLRNQNITAVSRFASFYNTGMLPVMGGVLPISSRIAFKFSFSYLNFLAKTNPWLFGFCTACTKAVLADVVAQKLVERKDKLDIRRTALFFAFGAIYSGMICNLLYSRVYPILFKSPYLKLNALGSILCDNLINTPFVMMPLLYMMKERFMFGGTLSTAINKYRTEAWESAVTAWKIWVPAHIITFGVLPAHLRLPYVSCVSFLFFTVVSFQQSMFDKRRKTIQNVYSGKTN